MEKYINRALWKNIFISILFLIWGFLLAMFPSTSSMAIAYSIGFILIINGISHLFNSSRRIIFYDPILIGITSLIFGIIILINPDIFNTIVPILLGIWLVIIGIIKYKFAIIIKDVGENDWVVVVITAILTIIAGIMLIIWPKIVAISIVFVMGLLIIVYSLSDIVNFFIIKKRVKEIAKYFNK